MISLLKFLDGPWEKVRGYLRTDLEHIEAALNQRWAATFGDSNQLKAATIAGDHSDVPRYVANTGTASAPTWEQVDLAAGVKNRLPLVNVVQALGASRLLGRGSAAAGDFENITLGTGLRMNGTVLSTQGGSSPNLQDVGLDDTTDWPAASGKAGPPGRDGARGLPGVDGEDGADGAAALTAPPATLRGYTVATLPAGSVQGRTAFATDLTTPTFLATAVGGGAVVGPVFFDGTNWVAF